MSSTHLNTPPARTWRDIPQPVAPRIRTLGREGRKRLFMAVGNIVGVVLVLGAAAWGVFEVIRLWETDPTRITAPTKGEPIRDFVVRTDGVLDKAWVKRTLDLPKDASLMELNLGDLRRRLEESGQVSKAVLERRFPDVLVVILQERTPVARVMARLGDAPPVVFMIARDGMVYSGSNYEATLANELPFIDGVRLLREGAGFLPIPGMEVVADLLGTAQASAPALYRSFKVVSLARFEADRTLTVKSTEVEAIVFGASQDSFYRQIARLDYILEESRRQGGAGPLKSINLALGDKQVPVLFETTADSRETTRTSTSSHKPAPFSGGALFTPSARNSSSTKRDF